MDNCRSDLGAPTSELLNLKANSLHINYLFLRKREKLLLNDDKKRSAPNKKAEDRSCFDGCVTDSDDKISNIGHAKAGLPKISATLRRRFYFSKCEQ